MALSLNTAKIYALWALKILLAVLFLAAASAKLVGVPKMVAEFNLIGLGQWFRYFTAVIEITGAVLLLLPGKTVFGAGLLTGICIGAFFAQVLAIHDDFIHTIVLGAILATIAVFHRKQLPI